ncbi:MAG TPA: class I SAM-dependent methyltransferase [Methylomirabilota bacterium]
MTRAGYHSGRDRSHTHGDGTLTLGWRWAVFQASRLVGRGLIAATRALTYAAAGILEREQLGRAIAGRWGQWGLDERYALLGLFGWEEPFVRRFLKPDDRILIVGSGSGREVIALRRDGYNVEGLEPAAAAAELSQQIMKKAGVEARIRIGGIETVQLDGAFDLFIFSWYCYSYIAHRPTRVAVLRSARDHLAPGGRIILSYITGEPIPKRLPVRLGVLAARASRAGWRPDRNDVLSFEPGGLHFEHHFAPGEVEDEARAAGLKVAALQLGDDGLIALIADE